jgi:hypothetical protein
MPILGDHRRLAAPSFARSPSPIIQLAHEEQIGRMLQPVRKTYFITVEQAPADSMCQNCQILLENSYLKCFIINGVNEDPATSHWQQELLVSISRNMESHEPTLTHISRNMETSVLVPGRKDEIICCHALWCPSWKGPYLSKEQNWQELKGYLSAPP